ncbi:hypothetical protein [Lysinibacter cavernae]|uniref:Uncharacterized protein n=1 Tax=Lysinibacter cavernae TaxID=1640652 RepID=A0A7X5QYE5_9MICO|nr:hypothetical protein [Lysinibacter cavernae]NIH52242.1 hypothetical protein [Lysinibacter cavernae]
MLLGTLIMPTASAQAVLQPGPGYSLTVYNNLTMFGGYVAPDGSIAYCLEWGKYAPTEASWPTVDAGVLADYNAWGAAELARINFIVSTWGQTQDPVQAAATALSIWTRHPSSATASVPDYSDGHWALAEAIPDPAVRGQVIALKDQILAAANAYNPTPVAGVGELGLTLDRQIAERGIVSVRGVPEDATGTLAFTGASASDTGARMVSGVRNGSVVNFTMHEADNKLNSLQVGISGVFSTPDRPSSEIRVWRTAQNAQDVASPGPKHPGTRFELTNAATREGLYFEPTVVTQVPSERVERGTTFSDTVKFSLAEGSRPWRRLVSGEYIPVTAVCRAYGPTLERPAVSALPPDDAVPIGQPISVTSASHLDPTTQWLPVDFGVAAEQAGYYTYVCSVDAAEQADERAVQAIQPNYHYQHEYGLAAETQFTRSQIRFRTQLDEASVAPGDAVQDTITPFLEGGGWVERDGEPVPVVLRGTRYFSETEPVRSPVAPAVREGPSVTEESTATGADPAHTSDDSTPPEPSITDEGTPVSEEPRVTVIGETLIELHGLEAVTTEALQTPTTAGWLTFQWCVYDEDQPDHLAGLVEEWCDDYGVPEETVQLRWPTVTTEASPTVVVPGDGGDSAAVVGEIPTHPDTELLLTFELFRASGEQPTCAAEERVFDTSDRPIRVDREGNFSSPSYRYEKAGTYYWVETLAWQNSATGEGDIIHVGACGLPNETTVATLPPPETPLTVTGLALGGMTPWLGSLGTACLALGSLLTDKRHKPGRGQKRKRVGWRAPISGRRRAVIA